MALNRLVKEVSKSSGYETWREEEDELRAVARVGAPSSVRMKPPNTPKNHFSIAQMASSSSLSVKISTAWFLSTQTVASYPL